MTLSYRCPVCHDRQCPGCEVLDPLDPDDFDPPDPEEPREATDEEYLRLEDETFNPRDP